MRRFFFDGIEGGDEFVTLPEGESRHISRVLRLTPGEEVELLDGTGNVFRGVITELGKRVLVRVTEKLHGGGTEGVRLIVGQGQLKGKKMDTVVQKCTELGVARMELFWSSRCQGKLNDLQGRKKNERYLRIIESACKQCYRPELMEVGEAVLFAELLSQYPDHPGRLRLLFWEEESEFSLHDLQIEGDTLEEVVLLLGPEGGLSGDEVNEARAAGWHTVSLGKRILRAETATLTAVSITQFLLKNI